MARKAYIGVPTYRVVLERDLTYSSGTTWSFGTNTANEANWTKGETYVGNVTIDGVTYSNITFSPDVGASWFGVYPESGDPIFGVYVAPNNQLYDYGLGLDTTTAHTIMISTGNFDGVARKVKQMYVGVENLARRVRKGYIGVGGVARPFWGDYDIAYYGNITSLNTNATNLASASIGNYALFAGGDVSYSVDTNVVNAYDKNLTRTLPTALKNEKYWLAGATAGDAYAIFAGGIIKYGDNSGSSGTETNTVDAYNTSLTRSTPTNLSSARYGIEGGAIGNHALFGCGCSGTYGTASNKMDVYDSALTKSTGTTFTYGVAEYGVANVGEYVLFAGGETPAAQSDGTSRATVNAYNKSLTKSTPTALSTARMTCGVTVGSGKHAIFAGSQSQMYGVDLTVIDVYNESLTRSSIANTINFRFLVSTSLGDYGLFSNNYDSKCYCFDKSLTMTTYSFYFMRKGAAAQVGNYAIFAGGYNENLNTQNKAVAFKLV